MRAEAPSGAIGADVSGRLEVGRKGAWDVAIADFIETHETFTTEELLASCAGSDATNRRLLTRACAGGRVARVTGSLYASRTGLFAASDPRPEAICAALAPDCWLVSTSALIVREGRQLGADPHVYLASEGHATTSRSYVSRWEAFGVSYSRRSVPKGGLMRAHGVVGELEAQLSEQAWLCAVSPRSPEADGTPLADVLEALAGACPDPAGLVGCCSSDRDVARCLAVAELLGMRRLCEGMGEVLGRDFREQWVASRGASQRAKIGGHYVGLFVDRARGTGAWWPRWAIEVPACLADLARGFGGMRWE